MPRALDRVSAGHHVDAYQEYTTLVGRLDGGRPLPDAIYQDLRQKAANPSRRLYVNWRNRSGLDCRAVGPQSMCFCTHRYNEHDWSAFDTRKVRCKMPGCSCTCFNYVPVRGSQDLICSVCRRSYSEHRPGDHGCPGMGELPSPGATQEALRFFKSSYTCSCHESYNNHTTVFESRQERELAGRQVDAGWMEEASKQGLPVCHLGGIVGFTSLADGMERAYAGLEEGFADPGAAGSSAGPGRGSGSGGDRLMQRLQLEDEVNTVTFQQGKAAGHLALAAGRAAMRRGNTSVRSSSSSGGALHSGRRSASSEPTGQALTLAGSAAVRGVSCGGQAAASVSRRSSPGLPSGRKLGGVRVPQGTDAIRQKRLARFDQVS
eukprot:TRINITY_DN7874_c0_g1_i2.p1 TRINITY_DN7874_c0_g1~~TRINITY_DN7874_c0_g1_i2.p1  ORF type:complete len:376 (-),score=57.25 TRINITY_DN7874_c0_g1_i2:140-1267(-)